MKTERVRVGVAVPTYNRPQGLARALASLARQSRPADLVVVVNDCGDSVDATVNRFPGLPLQTVEHSHNRGNAAARNTSIAQLQGYDLIVFLDDDDELDPGYLLNAVAEFERRPSLMFGWASHRIWIDEGEVPRLAGSSAWAGPSGTGALAWLTERRAGASGLVLRPAVFDRVGPFDEQLRSAVDTDWLIRAADESSALLSKCWLEVHRERNHTGVSSSFANRYKTYATLLKKHRELLVQSPRLHAEMLARTGRLALAAGDIASARRLLFESMQIRRGGKSLITFGFTFMPFASEAYRVAVRTRTRMR
jgi:glycosyltransferase involved in cell wall biosynthesis